MQDKQVVETQAQLAAALGKSASWVRDKLSCGMPGTPGRYVVDDCREWIRLDELARQAAKGKGDDPEMSGDSKSSPWLEEFRKWRAKQEELKYLVRQCELVEADAVRDWLQRFSVLMRGFGEKVNNVCPELSGELEGVLDQAAEMLDGVTSGQRDEG